MTTVLVSRRRIIASNPVNTKLSLAGSKLEVVCSWRQFKILLDLFAPPNSGTESQHQLLYISFAVPGIEHLYFRINIYPDDDGAPVYTPSKYKQREEVVIPRVEVSTHLFEYFSLLPGSNSAQSILQGVPVNFQLKSDLIPWKKAQVWCENPAFYEMDRNPSSAFLRSSFDGIASGSEFQLPLYYGTGEFTLMKLKCEAGDDTQIGVIGASTVVVFGDPTMNQPSGGNNPSSIAPVYIVERAKDVEYMLRQAREKVNFPANALLLHGPPGTGKSHLVKQVSQRIGFDLVHITASHILDLRVANPFEVLLKQYLQSTSDEDLGQQFREAAVDTVLFFDEIEVLLAEDEVADLESQRKVVMQFEQFLEELKAQLPDARNSVVVVGCTSSLGSLLPSTRRLFEREIAVELPSPNTRYVFLQHLISTHTSSSITSTELKDFSDTCHGYSLSDLENLLRVASTQSSLRQVRNSSESYSTARILPIERELDGSDDEDDTVDESESTLPGSQQSDCVAAKPSDMLSLVDLKHAKAQVKAESLKTGLHLVPSSTSRASLEVSGLDDALSQLIQSTVWMYRYADRMSELGVSAPKGVLLFGPPGTGKTMLAKRVASESSASFLSVSISDLVRGEVGGSEREIASLFRTARSVAPCVIFLDEMQALFGARDASSSHGKNMIAQLTLELDTLATDLHQIVVIGATNRPDWIDPALLRPGRFERCLYISPPSASTRAHILRNALKRFAVESSEVDEPFITELADRTLNFSGADLQNLCLKAAWNVIKERSPSRATKNTSAQSTPTKRFGSFSPFGSPSASPSPSFSTTSPAKNSYFNASSSIQHSASSTTVEIQALPPKEAISCRHLLDALSEFSPTITKEMLVLYQQFQTKYGRSELQKVSHGDPYGAPSDVVTASPTLPHTTQMSRFEQLKMERMRQLGRAGPHRDSNRSTSRH